MSYSGSPFAGSLSARRNGSMLTGELFTFPIVASLSMSVLPLAPRRLNSGIYATEDMFARLVIHQYV